MAGGTPSTTLVFVRVGLTRPLKLGSPAGQCDVVGTGSDTRLVVTSNSENCVDTAVPGLPSTAITAEIGGGVKSSLPMPAVLWSVIDAMVSCNVPSVLTAIVAPLTPVPAPVSAALTKCPFTGAFHL